MWRLRFLCCRTSTTKVSPQALSPPVELDVVALPANQVAQANPRRLVVTFLPESVSFNIDTVETVYSNEGHLNRDYFGTALDHLTEKLQNESLQLDSFELNFQADQLDLVLQEFENFLRFEQIKTTEFVIRNCELREYALFERFMNPAVLESRKYKTRQSEEIHELNLRTFSRRGDEVVIEV